ncbi:hypothetical protein F383_03187 [Gossypium arboreum]|uniref:Uncharacterized protein n=1 Tax=Gossypium arboreum TaxID=29729 RepID=A0A0B0P0F7_GOSAR|nr:hypothetical protein F383_03187 [Gossypium arboreum]
MSRFLHPIFQK